MWLSFRSSDGSPQRIELSGEKLVVGRDESADLVLDDDKVSRRHALLEGLADGRAMLHDLGSTNGTFVDGNRIAAPTLLSGGEQVKIGNILISVSLQETSAPATTLGGLPAVPPTELAPASAAPPALPPVAPSPPSLQGVQASSPSRIERLMLRRSLRRTQIFAGVASAVAAAGLGVGLYFALSGGDDQPTVPELIEAVKPSVVQIRGSVADGDATQGDGTGWVYDASEGLIVTNAHVSDAYPHLTVVTFDGEERPASVVAVAGCEDLAVLRVENTSGLETMKLGSQTDLKQGEEVVALGYPSSLARGDPLVATEGVVSVVKTQSTPAGELFAYPNVVQVDAPVNPGNSGGPLLGLDEELVGVNTFGSSLQNQNYAIGVDRVRAIVPGLADGKSIAWAGIAWEIPTSEDLEANGLPLGIVVTNIVPGSPAANAVNSTTGEQGLPANALLVAIQNADGTTTELENTSESYCRVVRKLRAGDEVAFVVYLLDGSTSEAQTYELTF